MLASGTGNRRTRARSTGGLPARIGLGDCGRAAEIDCVIARIHHYVRCCRACTCAGSPVLVLATGSLASSNEQFSPGGQQAATWPVIRLAFECVPRPMSTWPAPGGPSLASRLCSCCRPLAASSRTEATPTRATGQGNEHRRQAEDRLTEAHASRRLTPVAASRQENEASRPKSKIRRLRRSL